MSFKRNPDFLPRLRQTAKDRLNTATVVVRDHARMLLARGGASEPGEPPVNQSGQLSDSLTAYEAVDNGDHLIAAAGTDLYKMVFIERGTARAKPRPLLFTSLVESQADVMKVIGGRDA